MHKSWSKGFTKENHPSIRKISNTMKRKKLDNFKKWREEMKAIGKIKSVYPKLSRSENLAELIGMILGDGHIEKFPRTERLYIACNSKDVELIKRYSDIITELFGKKPLCMKIKTLNCVRISLYQKYMSKRLDIPTGARGKLNIPIKNWILKNKNYLISYLRGLYEAEGSFCVHKPTSTYKLFFSNRNESLLNNVFNGMEFLGFHPHRSEYQIQISRKEEVYKAIDLLKFRKY